MNEASFIDGEVILKQGEEEKKFYIIVEGSCRLTRVEDGQEVEVGILSENDHFGEVALLSAEPTAVSVTALTYVEVLTVCPHPPALLTFPPFPPHLLLRSRRAASRRCWGISRHS